MNDESKTFYWIAVNGASCAMSSFPMRHPRVTPTPEQMWGFPTLEEAQRAQCICLNEPMPKVIKFLSSLAPDISAGRIRYIRPAHPQPPTTGATSGPTAILTCRPQCRPSRSRCLTRANPMREPIAMSAPRLDAQQLRAAREAAAKRFMAIAMAELPEGWTYTFRKGLSGECRPTEKRIVAPKPTTRKALHIWLHEVAHARLQHGLHNKPSHVEEFEAERWAHARMRAYGVAVPRKMTWRAQHYVATKIRQAERAGAKRIDPDARRFAKNGTIGVLMSKLRDVQKKSRQDREARRAVREVHGGPVRAGAAVSGAASGARAHGPRTS
jgi:hypothetical protein